jgi:hypothetical protein
MYPHPSNFNDRPAPGQPTAGTCRNAWHKAEIPVGLSPGWVCSSENPLFLSKIWDPGKTKYIPDYLLFKSNLHK